MNTFSQQLLKVMFKQYFANLGFSEKEALIFKALYSLGTKPASTIANYTGIERTSTYKILQRLVKENLVFETFKGGIKHFFIPSLDILKTYTENKTKKIKKLENDFDKIKNELSEFENSKDKNIPKITLFDSVAGIKNIHEDILNNVLKNKYISLRLFASNTVDSQVSINEELKQSSKKLFSTLAEKNISIETYLGNGIMLMENISKTFDINTIQKLPASNSAINIYLSGSSIYIIIFKDSPFGIKIESEDLAFTMHFLFDKIEVKK